MDINHILYLITFVAILVYLVKINRVIYYFIFTCMIIIFFMVSRNMWVSISAAGVITALIFVFVDRQPLRKRKSMLIMEHLSNKKKKTAEAKKAKTSEVEEETFEPTMSEPKFDAKNTYMELFKSLKPDEIKTLNSDTQELIKTQQQLIETLQSMGPALKEGKTILDTFKNYFNDGGLDKLSL